VVGRGSGGLHIRTLVSTVPGSSKQKDRYGTSKKRRKRGGKEKLDETG